MGHSTASARRQRGCGSRSLSALMNFSARRLSLPPRPSRPIWNRRRSSLKPLRALVAQLDRAPDFESGGRGFESLRARQPAWVHSEHMGHSSLRKGTAYWEARWSWLSVTSGHRHCDAESCSLRGRRPARLSVLLCCNENANGDVRKHGDCPIGQTTNGLVSKHQVALPHLDAARARSVATWPFRHVADCRGSLDRAAPGAARNPSYLRLMHHAHRTEGPAALSPGLGP